jgi:hypothetical protein
MAYRIVEHVEHARTRRFTVLVNPEAPEDEQLFESFSWGMDVPWETVRQEAALLLDEKYAAPPKPLETGGTLAARRR